MSISVEVSIQLFSIAKEANLLFCKLQLALNLITLLGIFVTFLVPVTDNDRTRTKKFEIPSAGSAMQLSSHEYE